MQLEASLLVVTLQLNELQLKIDNSVFWMVKCKATVMKKVSYRVLFCVGVVGSRICIIQAHRFLYTGNKLYWACLINRLINFR